MAEDMQLNIANLLSGTTVQIQVTNDTSVGDVRGRLAVLYGLSPESPAKLQLLCAGHTIVDTQVVGELPTLELQ